MVVPPIIARVSDEHTPEPKRVRRFGYTFPRPQKRRLKVVGLLIVAEACVFPIRWFNGQSVDEFLAFVFVPTLFLATVFVVWVVAAGRSGIYREADLAEEEDDE